MSEPLFWLSLSLLLVSVSLTAVLVIAIPVLGQLGRAAHSAEKLFDLLRQDFPPTLEAIRLSGLEISELTDEINTGVKTATEVVKQVDQSFTHVKEQGRSLNNGTSRLVTGLKAAWRTWNLKNHQLTKQHLKPTFRTSK